MGFKGTELNGEQFYQPVRETLHSRNVCKAIVKKKEKKIMSVNAIFYS